MSATRVLVVGLALAALGVFIWRADNYQLYLLALVGLTAVVGVGLNVLLGLSGQISLGHVAFYAIGAYVVAILGGIGSAWGVVLAGLIYGVAEALVTALLGSTYTQIVSFSLVIASLTVMPNGLFGRAGVRKV